MFVARDVENNQVFGPFDSQDQGESWVKDYLKVVEGRSSSESYSEADFLAENFWDVQEVQFVDADDRTFADFIGNPIDPTSPEDYDEEPLPDEKPEGLVLSGKPYVSVQRDMAKATDAALAEISEILYKFLDTSDMSPQDALLRVHEIASKGLDEDFVPEGEEPLTDIED